jgi:hypothetical protein
MSNSDNYLAPLLQQSELAGEISIVGVTRFAAVDEPGADALLGTLDQNLLPVGGDVMLYGDGGTGKTTLAVDLGFHLAAGRPWLGIPVPRAARVLLIENEGPRPLFRRKLRRKLDVWGGATVAERLFVWETPWSVFRFGDLEFQAQLARHAFELELDLVIAGPVTELGMEDAGTIQEVRRFAGLVATVRERSLRPIAFLLVHHENKGGRVSGAWEGVGDTLLHVQGSGHGRTRLFVQKSRWGNEYHAKTFRLLWSPGETFELADEDDEETRAARVYDEIERAVLEHPGSTWRLIRDTVGGNERYVSRRRDVMLQEGVILDLGTSNRSSFWHRDDPAKPMRFEDEVAPGSEPVAEPVSGSGAGATREPLVSDTRSGSKSTSGSAAPTRRVEPLVRSHSAPEPEKSHDDEEDIEW